MVSIHPDARCLAESVGEGTDVGAFATVDRQSRIGTACAIGSHVMIESDAVVGDRAVLDSGCRIGPGVVVEDDVRIGRKAVVRAGAVVSADVPPNAVVEGNPARIVGYIDAREARQSFLDAGVLDDPESPSPVALEVGGAALYRLPRFSDLRGALVPIEFEFDLPFAPRRLFFVFDVPNELVRGEHAHKRCEQFLIAVHGALSVIIDDGRNSLEIRLDRPNLGLYMPAVIWGEQHKFSPGAALAVFASRSYEADDYIRDYPEFLSYVADRS